MCQDKIILHRLQENIPVWGSNIPLLPSFHASPPNREGTLLSLKLIEWIECLWNSLSCCMKRVNIYYGIVGNRGLPWFMFFCFFGYENFLNLIFGPSFRQPARKVSSGGNLFEKQGFICYRPVNMIQQN